MKKNIVKNTSYLYIMNIVKIFFPLIILPYMTRVLSLEAYGVVAYVKAVMQYMQIFIDFGFGLSGTRDIVRAREDEHQLSYEVGNIFMARMALCAVSVVALIGVTFGIPLLRENMMFTFLSFAPVFLSCFLFEYVFRGIEHMEDIAIPFIVMKTVSTVFTFVFVKSDDDMIWIPVLDTLGTAAAVAVVLYAMKKMNIHMKFGNIKDMWSKIKSSAIYFFSNMATTAFSALNTLLIGLYIEPAEVAYWSLCLQMVGAAQSLYTPVTDGIYPQMMKTQEMGIVKKTAKLFMPVVTAGCIFTFFVAKYALLILGGEKYMVAESLLRMLIPLLFFSFPAMLLGWPALGAIGKEAETTATTIIAAVFQVLGLVLLIFTHHFTLLSIAFMRGITEFVLFSLRLYYCRKFRKLFN